jgi:catechol 2,3-dioxygenase-like lactoylglutathione lyase family enzyme
MIKVNEIAFVGYPATEKQRARDFYEGVLGLKPTMDMAMGENYWIEYDIGTSTLGVSNYWKPAAEPKMGPTAALEVDNFDETIALLKGKGVRFAEEGESSVCRMALALDPDGNSIWIHKRNPNRGAYSGPEIPFTCYPVTDRQRARDFYEGMLGLVRTQPDFEAPDGFWSEYNIGTGTLAVCSFWKPSAEPSMGPAIALEVDDFETAVAELKAKAVPFPMEPMETPVCHLCVVTDPDGNSLFIHKRKPGHG